jgi:hypothetical protein
MHHQAAQPPQGARWIAELATLGKPGLIQESEAQVLESRLLLLALKAPHQWLVQVQLQDRLLVRRLLAHRLEDPGQAGAHVVLGEHHADR